MILYQRERQPDMKSDNTIKRSLGDPVENPSDWDRLNRMTEEDIQDAARRDPDTQPDGDEFFDRAEVIRTPAERDTRRLNKRKDTRFEMRMEEGLKAWADEYAASIGIKTAGLVRMLLLKEKKRFEAETPS